MITWPNRNEINEETKNVSRDITAGKNEKHLPKVEAESSSEKCGMYEIALFAALWNRLMRTTDSVRNSYCRKMAHWSLLSLKLSIKVNIYLCIRQKGIAVVQWLRCCVTNRKVTASIPDGVTGIFHWHNPSDRTTALGSTQPLTEMSTRSVSGG